MNYHRLFFSLIHSLIIISISLSLECNEQSNQSDISFDMKIHQSPLVLIGISLYKHLDLHVPNLFNVSFLVQCILKGRPTERFIQIVQAGTLLGRRSCQRLNVNKKYIVFLEPFFDQTYRPVDLEEISYNTQTESLLNKTCGLSRTYPLTESNDTEPILTNQCPVVDLTNCLSDLLIETTTSSVMLEKNTIDLRLLSLLLAEYQHPNLSSTFLSNQNRKSLFSDDDIRKNQANRFSSIIFLNLIQFIFCKRLIFD